MTIFKIIFLIIALFSLAFPSGCGWSVLLPNIDKYQSKGTQKINSSMPIAAEYCLQENYNSESLPQRVMDSLSLIENVTGKLTLRLVNVLDTLTKIYPYKYEDLRKCEWIDFHQRYDLKFGNEFYGSGTITSGTHYSMRYNGYDYDYVPKTGKTVNDYYASLMDKFYFGLQYMKIWNNEILEKNGINSNYTGIMPIEWKLSGVGKCVPEKEEYYSYFFSGTYKIYITGKCNEKDFKGIDRLRKIERLDYMERFSDLYKHLVKDYENEVEKLKYDIEELNYEFSR